MSTVELVVTERLRLYRPTLDDLAPIHALFATEGAVSESSAAVSGWIEHWERHGFGYWVVRNDAGEFLGIGGIANVREDGEVAALYYKIAARARGRGYATELARAALDAAFGYGVRCVETIVSPLDTISIGVAERAGMTQSVGQDSDGNLRFVARADDRS